MIVRLAYLSTGLIGLSLRKVIILILAPIFHCRLRTLLRPKVYLTRYSAPRLRTRNKCLATWHDRKCKLGFIKPR